MKVKCSIITVIEKEIIIDDKFKALAVEKPWEANISDELYDEASRAVENITGLTFDDNNETYICSVEDCETGYPMLELQRREGANALFFCRLEGFGFEPICVWVVHFAQKMCKNGLKFMHIIFPKPIDKFQYLWYNKTSSRGNTQSTLQGSKKFFKKFSKTP